MPVTKVSPSYYTEKMLQLSDTMPNSCKMKDEVSENPATLAQKVSSALFYAVSSIMIIFINKIVLTNYKFPSYLCLGIGQMLATIIILYTAQRLEMITFQKLTVDTPRKIFPLPIIFVLNLVSGLGATKKLNLPMFTVLRRFGILMTMVFEYWILGVKASFGVKVSVCLMVFGAIVAGLYDLTFDVVGYFLIFVNDVCTASNGVYMKQKLEAKDLGKYGIMFYNTAFMLVPAVLVAEYMGDFEKAFKFEGWHDPIFVSQFCLSCVCGFVLNYSIVLSTHYNSALTTACVGLENLFVTYVGMFTSGDYIFSAVNFIGINISVFGSILYTYVTFIKHESPEITEKRKINGNKSDPVI